MPFGVEVGDRLLGRGLLLGVVIEDDRAVLRADVGALPVLGGRIVDREEHIQEVAVGDHRGIEADLHHLGVAGAAAADLLVARMVDVAAGIAGHYALDPLEILEHRLQAPEAPATKGGELATVLCCHRPSFVLADSGVRHRGARMTTAPYADGCRRAGPAVAVPGSPTAADIVPTHYGRRAGLPALWPGSGQVRRIARPSPRALSETWCGVRPSTACRRAAERSQS